MTTSSAGSISSLCESTLANEDMWPAFLLFASVRQITMSVGANPCITNGIPIRLVTGKMIDDIPLTIAIVARAAK